MVDSSFEIDYHSTGSSQNYHQRRQLRRPSTPLTHCMIHVHLHNSALQILQIGFAKLLPRLSPRAMIRHGKMSSHGSFSPQGGMIPAAWEQLLAHGQLAHHQT
ncbi:hypothetical protein D5086_001486 [Populus alba]|uniref:Uncharacterized protein n=1 Tax=Populus alba TaxID=43335 RepID=A0ACC4CYV3_POPAL